MNPSIAKLFNLDGQVALVTGGSRGLGLQMAQALGEAGARIMLTSRKEGDLREAAAELNERGIETHIIAADASDAAAAQTVVNATMQRFGRIDVLVNNAGATWGAPAEDYPLEAWDKVMNLNVRSLFVYSQAVARAHMIQAQRGRIINIASIAGLGGNPAAMTTVAYNSSKAAAINFTRALAAEWGKYGINVNALAPGFFPTKMANGLLQEMGGADRMAQTVPLRRLGGEGDLAGATLLFATEAGRHITGQVLAVDGGVSCVVGG